jgi:hypothetical protein
MYRCVCRCTATPASRAARAALLPTHVQVGGTLGGRIMSGQTKQVVVDKDTRVDVNCKVCAVRGMGVGWGWGAGGG